SDFPHLCTYDTRPNSSCRWGLYVTGQTPPLDSGYFPSKYPDTSWVRGNRYFAKRKWTGRAMRFALTFHSDGEPCHCGFLLPMTTSWYAVESVPSGRSSP